MKNYPEILDAFDLPGGERLAVPFGNGHINSTFMVRIEGTDQQYILQRINSYVFIHPKDVMENIQRVTEFLRGKITESGGNPDRETITLVPARSGEAYAEDAEGQVWRVMLFVPDTFSPELPDNLNILQECGSAFGRFARLLDDFPASSLHETIHAFHDTPARLHQLEEAVQNDSAHHLKEVTDELAFARSLASETRILTDALAAGKLPLRVTHNDTKVNNVLLDKHTEKAVCVIDLDTVMPGLLAYDFGDAIRVGACSAAEDEQDLDLIHLELPKYRAFVRGFLSELKGMLSRDELLSLEAGARIMTLENGLRFLADHLNGDVYFKIHRPGQNLDRARAQFALYRDMDRHRDEMISILMEEYGLS